MPQQPSPSRRKCQQQQPNGGGSAVVLSTNLGSLGSVTDNGDGTYTATLTSATAPGTATISGTINGQAMTAATVNFVALALGINTVAGTMRLTLLKTTAA